VSRVELLEIWRRRRGEIHPLRVSAWHIAGGGVWTGERERRGVEWGE